jgi:hypothetical protein
MNLDNHDRSQLSSKVRILMASIARRVKKIRACVVLNGIGIRLFISLALGISAG